MANCCFTEIDIYTDHHRKELQALYDNLSKWTEGDWRENWLGNILIGSGVSTKEEISEGRCPYRCRGSLIYTEMYDDDHLHVTTETAWVPMMSMWKAVCEKCGIKDASIVFTGEESGCGVFVTNDSDVLSAPYAFDGYFDEEDEDMICFFDPDNADMHDGYVEEDKVSEKRLNEVLELIKKEYPDLKQIEDLDDYMKGDNSYLNIHKYERAEISDF